MLSGWKYVVKEGEGVFAVMLFINWSRREETRVTLECERVVVVVVVEIVW